jgi:hypothetical protein
VISKYMAMKHVLGTPIRSQEGMIFLGTCGAANVFVKFRRDAMHLSWLSPDGTAGWSQRLSEASDRKERAVVADGHGWCCGQRRSYLMLPVITNLTASLDRTNGTAKNGAIDGC